MLTTIERTAIRTKCERLSLSGLEDLAIHCARENRPDAAKYVRDIIAEREMKQRANAVPFEVSGMSSRRHTATVAQPATQRPPYWTPERVQYAALAVVGSGGVVALLAFVVIPAVIVAAKAVVSAVAFSAPYIAGAILAFVVIRSALFGEKKTHYPAESSQNPSGGNVYNVYVGEGQVHVHSGGNPPGA